MWIQHWLVTELKKIDRKARKIIVENGGKQPCRSMAILYSIHTKRKGRQRYELDLVGIQSDEDRGGSEVIQKRQASLRIRERGGVRS